MVRLARVGLIAVGVVLFVAAAISAHDWLQLRTVVEPLGMPFCKGNVSIDGPNSDIICPSNPPTDIVQMQRIDDEHTVLTAGVASIACFVGAELMVPSRRSAEEQPGTTPPAGPQ